MFNVTWVIFPAISWREQVTFRSDDNDDNRFVLEHHAKLDFYSASSLKQQFESKHVAPLWHIILITIHLAFSLTLSSCVLSGIKYQFNSLWIDSTGTRTHDLPHLRRARYPLHNRWWTHDLPHLRRARYPLHNNTLFQKQYSL